MKITHQTPSVSVAPSDDAMPGKYGWIDVHFEPGTRPSTNPLPPGWVLDETDPPTDRQQAYYVHMDHAIWHKGMLPTSLAAPYPDDPRITHEVWANNPLEGDWTIEFRADRWSCIRYLDVVTGTSCRLWEFSIRPVKR